MRVAIAGAGIAGLTSAIALAARGFAVDLYERAPVLEEIGAGIQLSPNAMAVLDQLGVVDDLRGHLFEPEALVVRDGRSGITLTRVPLGKTMRKRYGAPYCTLHRADLQAGLVAAARRDPAISFHLSAEVREVRQTDMGIAFMAGGESRQAELLVAADGVHSATRTGYFGHPRAISLGRSAWRATLPAAAVADRVSLDEIGLWLGAAGHLVHYPIADGAQLNVVVIASGEALLPPTTPFGKAARQLIDCVPAWKVSRLAVVDSAPPWAKGRVVLIGDAAHAMAPSAAQGAAQGIEDAWALAITLVGSADPTHALAAHARLRRPRAIRVAHLAARNLNSYEMHGVPALLRNLILRALPATLILSQLDWLFGWRPK